MERIEQAAMPPRRLREQPDAALDPPEDLAASVKVTGSEYRVDLGDDSQTRYHRVQKDRTCSCGTANCFAIAAVRAYLLNGGKRARDGLPPTRCPICSGRTMPDPAWNGKYTHEPGWRCEHGGLKHFLDAKTARILQAQAKNPWLIPPAPGYPGVRRDEIMTFEECAAISRKVLEESNCEVPCKGCDPTD
jgi:hypothetical protein